MSTQINQTRKSSQNVNWARLQKGRLVYDRWWWWRVGRITARGKTFLRVSFPGKVVRYDRAHASQFLALK